MTQASQEDRTASLSASACSVEIFVHQLLLSLVILSFTLLIFPFLIFHVGGSLLNANLSEDWRQWKGIASRPDSPVLNDSQEIVIAVALTGVVVFLTAFRYWRTMRQQEAEARADGRYRSLKGDRGTALKQRVANLWVKVGSQTTRTSRAARLSPIFYPWCSAIERRRECYC
jgi:hypothetical protein